MNYVLQLGSPNTQTHACTHKYAHIHTHTHTHTHTANSSSRLMTHIYSTLEGRGPGEEIHNLGITRQPQQRALELGKKSVILSAHT